MLGGMSIVPRGSGARLCSASVDSDTSAVGLGWSAGSQGPALRPGTWRSSKGEVMIGPARAPCPFPLALLPSFAGADDRNGSWQQRGERAFDKAGLGGARFIC